MSGSMRMLSYVALTSAYALISLSIAKNSLHAALFVPPIVLMCLFAARPRWSSPRTVVLAGLGMLVPACLLGVDEWSVTSALMVAAEFVTLALIGLCLVESVRSDVPDDGLRDFGEGDVVSEERTRAIVSRELRRSRRAGTPVALLVLRGMEAFDPTDRRALAGWLCVHGREFDMVFAPSADELAVLCVDTTRSGALEYVERIRVVARVRDFAVACFPDDAVTLQGLFDAARDFQYGREPREVAAAVRVDSERRRDSEVMS